jgi:hypothetical protein
VLDQWPDRPQEANPDRPRQSVLETARIQPLAQAG